SVGIAFSLGEKNLGDRILVSAPNACALIPSGTWRSAPSACRCQRTHGFASPSYDGFAFSRMNLTCERSLLLMLGSLLHQTYITVITGSNATTRILSFFLRSLPRSKEVLSGTTRRW